MSDNSLQINPASNSLTVVGSGRFTISTADYDDAGAGFPMRYSASTSITNNLGTIPAIFGFVETSTYVYPMPYTVVDRSTGYNQKRAAFYAGTDVIGVTIESDSKDILTFRYFLYIDKAN